MIRVREESQNWEGSMKRRDKKKSCTKEKDCNTLPFLTQDLTVLFKSVKSRSSGLKSDGVLEGRRKVSTNWTRGSDRG